MSSHFKSNNNNNNNAIRFHKASRSTMIVRDANNNTTNNNQMKQYLEVDFETNPTKLYLAITNSDWDTAAENLKLNPTEARTWVTRTDPTTGAILWRFLPLHSACARQPPESLVDALLRAHPEAAMETDDQGMLPLHYACGNLASEDVIHMLLVANPRSVTQKEPTEERLPIHFVCRWGASSMSVIHMLLAVFPESIVVGDKEGNTALDLEEDPEVLDIIRRCGLSARTKNYSAAFRILNDEGVDKEKMEESEQKVKDFGMERVTLQDDIQKKANKIAELEKLLDHKDDDMDRLREDKKSLKKMVCMLSEEKEDCKKEAKNEKDNLNFEIQGMLDKCNTLNDEKDHVTFENTQLMEKIRQLEAARESDAQRLMDKEIELDRCHEEKEKLNQMIATLTEDGLAAEKDRRQMEGKCQWLEKQKEVWMVENARITKDNKMLLIKMENMMRHKTECKEEVEGLLLRLENTFTTLYRDQQDDNNVKGEI